MIETLQKAHEVKSARAQVRRLLANDEVALGDALEQDCCRTMAIYDLLRSQRYWGRHRALTALRCAGGIPELTHIGHLTDRQKRALLQACGCESERSGVA